MENSTKGAPTRNMTLPCFVLPLSFRNGGGAEKNRRPPKRDDIATTVPCRCCCAPPAGRFERGRAEKNRCP
eukprot:scaffold34640_cov143-Amphora_coffeaeformis.AAC.6